MNAKKPSAGRQRAFLYKWALVDFVDRIAVDDDLFFQQVGAHVQLELILYL